MSKDLGYEYDIEIPAYVAVSHYCNIRCSYCYVPEANKSNREEIDRTALETAKKLREKAHKERFAFNNVYLHGAEPTTLSPKVFAEVVEILGSICTSDTVGVQSNGVGLNHKYHERMGDLSKKLKIGFTLDLPPSAHDLNRQMTYKRVLKNLEIARDLGYGYRVLCGITSETVQNLKETKAAIEYLHEHHPSMAIAFKPISGDNRMGPKQRKRWGDFLANHGWYDYDHSVWGNLCQTNGNGCFWLEFCANGDVTSCNKEFDHSKSFANWHDEGIQTIVNRRRTLFQNYKIGVKCFGCKYWSVCKGGCPVDRYEVPENVVDENGVRISRVDTKTLDCETRIQIFKRLEASDIDPLKAIKKLPTYHRQNQYKRWVAVGKRLGFRS